MQGAVITVLTQIIFIETIFRGVPPSLFNVEPGQLIEIKVFKRTGEDYTTTPGRSHDGEPAD